MPGPLESAQRTVRRDTRPSWEARRRGRELVEHEQARRSGRAHPAGDLTRCARHVLGVADCPSHRITRPPGATSGRHSSAAAGGARERTCARTRAGVAEGAADPREILRSCRVDGRRRRPSCSAVSRRNVRLARRGLHEVQRSLGADDAQDEPGDARRHCRRRRAGRAGTRRAPRLHAARPARADPRPRPGRGSP